MKKLCIAIGVIFAVLVISTAPSYAGKDVIYGCIGKETGRLRVVSSPTNCKRSEIPIFWNKVGPQGEQGPVGPQGPEGPQGPAGAGSLGVYNGDGRFLGYLGKVINDGPRATWLEVLDPVLMRFYQISAWSSPVAREASVIPTMFFETSNCTIPEDATCYSYPGIHLWAVLKFEPNNTYYIVDTENYSVKIFGDMLAFKEGSNDCQPYDSESDAPAFPVVPITPPWAFTNTIEYPIEIRPIE